MYKPYDAHGARPAWAPAHNGPRLWHAPLVRRRDAPACLFVVLPALLYYSPPCTALTAGDVRRVLLAFPPALDARGSQCLARARGPRYARQRTCPPPRLHDAVRTTRRASATRRCRRPSRCASPACGSGTRRCPRQTRRGVALPLIPLASPIANRDHSCSHADHARAIPAEENKA